MIKRWPSWCDDLKNVTMIIIMILQILKINPYIIQQCIWWLHFLCYWNSRNSNENIHLVIFLSVSCSFHEIGIPCLFLYNYVPTKIVNRKLRKSWHLVNGTSDHRNSFCAYQGAANLVDLGLSFTILKPMVQRNIKQIVPVKTKGRWKTQNEKNNGKSVKHCQRHNGPMGWHHN